MNVESRFNFQRGKEQDIRNESTTYNIENEIDRFILARVQCRNNAAENRAIVKETDIEKIIAAAEEKIVKDIEPQIVKLFR